LNECGIFGTNNGWVTDCFSIENTKHSFSELIIKSIDLCDSDVSEDQISPDILIGLIVVFFSFFLNNSKFIELNYINLI
jgi:hypothetical protein